MARTPTTTPPPLRDRALRWARTLYALIVCALTIGGFGALPGRYGNQPGDPKLVILFAFAGGLLILGGVVGILRRDARTHPGLRSAALTVVIGVGLLGPGLLRVVPHHLSLLLSIPAAGIVAWALIRSRRDPDRRRGVRAGWGVRSQTRAAPVPAELRADQRMAQRDRARTIASEHPERAREMGLGRPDLHGEIDLGLVDVNNAPVSVLATLPGVDNALAARIDATRRQVHGFASLDDMGSLLDLDAPVVDGLKSWAIFLPRPGAA